MRKLLWIETSWCNKRKPGAHGGVDYFRILMPSEALNKYSDKYKCETRGQIVKEKNGKSESFEDLYKRLFIKEKFDGIVIKVIDDPVSLSQVKSACVHYGKKLILDMDDDYMHIDSNSPVYRKFYPGSKASKILKHIFKWSDGIIVENKYLKSTYADYRCNIVHNCIDEILLNKFHKLRYNKKSGGIRIGYFGSITHKSDLEPYLKNINNILQKYEGSKFIFFGGIPDIYDFTDIPKDRIEFVAPEDDYPDFMKKLAGLNLTVGIAPLKISMFNKCKSPIKYFEYTIAGVPTIAQGHKDLPYARVIKHNDTGLLFDNGDELESYLHRLITNQSLREEIVENAVKDISQYSVQNNWQNWEKAFDDIFGEKQ